MLGNGTLREAKTQWWDLQRKAEGGFRANFSGVHRKQRHGLKLGQYSSNRAKRL